MNKEKIAFLILKISVAFTLFYMAWGAYIHPKVFGVYIPSAVLHLASTSILLWIFSVLCVVLGAFTLFESRPFVPPLVVALYLGLIVFLNARWGTPSFDTYYKDIAIALAALSLAIKSKSMW